MVGPGGLKHSIDHTVLYAPNFVIMGGDGYLSFLQSSKTIDSRILMFDVAKNYMQNQKHYQPFYANRIVLEN